MKVRGFKAPDSIEPIIALRGWRVDAVAGTLHSIVQPVPWTPREPLKAECSPGVPGVRDHPRGENSPSPKCTCGIYAAFTMKLVVKYMPAVIGRVALWGDVVTAEYGVRAQYAYPLELYVLSHFSPWVAPSAWYATQGTVQQWPIPKETAKVVADRYGVPTIHLSSLQDLPTNEEWGINKGR